MKVLIAGSKGQAKDLVSGFFWDNHVNEVVFFDDVSESESDFLFDRFKIIRSLDGAKKYFQNTSPNYIVAVASPVKRKLITDKLKLVGGRSIRFLSPKALIYDTTKISDEGVMVQIDCIISPEVNIEKGVLVNAKCIISSNVTIGEYSSLAPNVFVNEGVTIGKNCIISTGVTILPNVKIGDNVKIWMNKIIEKDIPSDTNYI